MIDYFDFAAYPLWQNVVVFLITAAIVWVVGSRLSVYADIIADETGLGEVFVGLLLLAVVTSLPEVGRTITAALLGLATLAVDSLLGGIALQTAILAVADLAVARATLTYFAPRPVLLLEGVIVVFLLGIALAGIAAGEIVQWFGVGLWSVLIFGLYAFSLYALKSYENHETWQPVDVPEEIKQKSFARQHGEGTSGKGFLFRVALLFGLASMAIFVSGVVLAEVGEALAVQTGLGMGFVGATLLAFASSLPEVSTTIGAVRIGAYALAISNIFGTNAFLVALLFVADIFYRPGPVLQAVDRSALFLAAVGVVVTSVYIIGMIERRNRLFLGMGLDSFAVLIIYLLSLPILYLIR